MSASGHTPAGLADLRFGIAILADQRWAQGARRWRLAEEYGFDHAWTYDHLGWRRLVDGPWFDAIPTLTAAAGVTSRIQLGILVASPNFRHPVSFARQLISVDDVSRGRLVAGLGAGTAGTSFDNAVLGIPPLTTRQRASRFAEFAELLDLILRSDRVTWHGEYYSAVDARNLPGCVQVPRVPFVVAGHHPRSIEVAARIGDGWVTIGTQADNLDKWWGSVAEGMHRLKDALGEAGRDQAAMRKYLLMDAAPVFSLSSAEYFAEAAGRAGELGFTDVITHWPRPDGPYAGEESVLEAVAASLVSRPERRGAPCRPGPSGSAAMPAQARAGRLPARP
jgi:alkanesulfonate monooxygenase SsuD/methylene tetrahydromethanopterin reductase-like flavin-dependent oxidoreductase (luciferase family)